MGERERETILARRRRFIVAALSGMTVAALGCEGEVETEGSGAGGGPQPCLDVGPCLTPPQTGGMGGAGGQAGAQVCLSPPLGGQGGVGGNGGSGGTGGTGGSGGTGG